MNGKCGFCNWKWCQKNVESARIWIMFFDCGILIESRYGLKMLKRNLRFEYFIQSRIFFRILSIECAHYLNLLLIKLSIKNLQVDEWVVYHQSNRLFSSEVIIKITKIINLKKNTVHYVTWYNKWLIKITCVVKWKTN